MPDSRSFRHLMGNFATGIAVALAVGAEGKPTGITINSFTSVSLEPQLVSFCLDKKAHVFPVFIAAARFSVNLLTAEQEDLSRSFATRDFPQPPEIWGEPQHGCPILRDTLGWITCRKTAMHEAGDHFIIVGEVIELATPAPPKQPLLYFRGNYRRF